MSATLQDLRARIVEAHRYLLREFQTFYLIHWRGPEHEPARPAVWLLTNTPRRGARMVGRFNDEISLADFSAAVYEVLSEMRPG